MILVDTSIWVDHFKFGDPLPDDDSVPIHRWVVGELALGVSALRSSPDSLPCREPPKRRTERSSL